MLNWIPQEVDLKDEAWEMLQYIAIRQQTDLSGSSSYA